MYFVLFFYISRLITLAMELLLTEFYADTTLDKFYLIYVSLFNFVNLNSNLFSNI